MDINRDNYEAYFLDFAEGNLSSAEEEVLHRFLKFNPDLLEDFRQFKITTLSGEKISYPHKDNLKKSFPEKGDNISSSNFEMFSIAYLENDLSEQQIESFELFLTKNPEYRSMVEMYKNTHLQDERIIFPHKKTLKRRSPIIISWKIIIPIAAAATIALMVLFGPQNTIDSEQIASTVETATEPQSENVEKATEQTIVPKSTSPATLKVIRSSKAPAPATEFNKQVKKDQQVKEEKKNEDRPLIAGINLHNNVLLKVDIPDDQIIPVAINPPTINPSSLSFRERARYQFQKANDVLDEEDVLILNIASSGLKGLNKITGSNAQLLASKNEEGSISGIQFKSRYLNFTAPISRDK